MDGARIPYCFSGTCLFSQKLSNQLGRKVGACQEAVRTANLADTLRGNDEVNFPFYFSGTCTHCLAGQARPGQIKLISQMEHKVH